MAEFSEVMRQANRMCVRYSVDECDANRCELNQAGCLLQHSPETWTSDEIQNIERVVMQWAAEHPEPRYPTWLKYLVIIGVLPEKLPYSPSYKDTLMAVLEPLKGTEIPADIAEKLGIKPIGVKQADV